MKSNQVKTLALLILTFLSSSTYASHLLGGEITFFCVGGGNYKFRVTFYKDCTGISFSDPTLTVTAFGVTGLNSANITCSLVGTAVDISPQCTQVTGGPGPVRCTNGPTGSTPGANGAVSRFVYESGPINFNNVPAPGVGTPYIFFTNIGGCCRNPNNNTNCGGSGALVLRCLMYRYEKNGVGVPPSLLCDRAPEFAEPPTSLQVRSSADTAIFNNVVIDRDLDSIAYGIDQPWEAFSFGSATLCNYSGAYSIANPFPGIIAFNRGAITSAINPFSGEIEFRPTTSGNWLTSIRVESWRCGQKIAEVFRDFQLQIINPPANYPAAQRRPYVTPPFPDSIGNRAKYFVGSVFVGDTVEFTMEAIDFQPFGQQVDIVYNGIQFATGATEANALLNLCEYPPCAYLKGVGSQNGLDPITISNNVSSTVYVLGFGYRAFNAVGASFIWPTACSNLPQNDCGQRVAQYTFTVTAKDDQCPVNGKFIKAITVNLLPQPLLPDPELKCISAVDDSIRLEWTQFVDQTYKEIIDSSLQRSITRRYNSFKKYYIYRDTNGTGFVLIDSIVSVFPGDGKVFETTYTDGRSAYDGNIYTYKVSNVSGCFNTESALSNGLTPMKLSLTKNGLSYAQLDWNAISNPLPATSHNQYIIERAYGPVNPFGIIGTTTNWPYYDTITICNDTVRFRVSVRDSSGCTSYSTIVGGIFQDKPDTEPVDITYVTVDTSSVANNNRIRLRWAPSKDRDVVKYYILSTNDPLSATPTYVSPPHDSTSGYLATEWYDTTGFFNANASIYHYNIAAADSCPDKHLSVPKNSSIHNNILVNTVLDKCFSNIKIDWNEYNNWPQGVLDYKLYKSINGGPDQLLYTAASGGVLNYTDFISTAGDYLCYTVVATSQADNSITSLSNKNCLLADVLQIPKFLYIRYASVDTVTQNIDLACLIDTLADLDYFIVDRSVNDQNNYEPYDTILRSTANLLTTANGTYGMISFIDRDVKTARQSYYYRIRSVDVCGTINDTSNYVRSIVLKGTADNDWFNRIKWNNYAQFEEGVGQYDIYKMIPSLYNYFSYNASNGLDLNAEENVVGTIDDDGKFCYYVEAIEFQPNVYGLQDTARSNVICVQQLPRLYAPNIFVPEGVNKNFAVKGTYILPLGYTMTVYNRWGDVVFKTNDIDQGWNGYLDNGVEECQMGIYVWKAEFLGTDGNIYSQKGTVQLVR